jgi:hypothetical protein
MFAICSNKPRATTATNRNWQMKTGAAAWGRDVFHLTNDTQPGYYPERRSLCGIDASDWLLVGEVGELDDNCCERCRKKVS